MHYYQDITLIPDAESSLGFIWRKVYSQVHLALVESKKRGVSVAIAFPAYSDSAFPLGNKLRLFAGDEQTLVNLNLGHWLKRLQDYCHTTSIRSVPSTHKHVRYSRRQFKSNPERLARRRAKRHNETMENALKHYKSFSEPKSNVPFVKMASLSTGGNHEFRLFIEQAVCDEAISGDFNSYGLSKTATVPWF